MDSSLVVLLEFVPSWQAKTIEELMGVEGLDLGGKGLMFLPESVGKLENMTELNLSQNQLDSLPESIGLITKVTGLSVSHNRLSILPESLGQLVKLTLLDIGFNKLSSLPGSIGKLTDLDTLSLNENQLSSLPKSIGHLTNLTYLSLNNNQLSSLPESIGRLTNLDALHIYNNPISDLPDSITCLISMKRLRIEFQGRISITLAPAGITGLPCWTNAWKDTDMSMTVSEALKKLRLYKYDNINLRDITSLIAEWGTYSNINISNNSISTLPDELSLLKSLRGLNIANNKFSRFPDVFPKMTWMTFLNISGNILTELPVTITKMVKLSTLVIADASGKVTIRRTPPEISTLPCYKNGSDIKHLLGHYCNEKLKDIDTLIEKWKSCESITLAHNQISRLPNELSTLSSLRDLNLEGNRLIGFPDVLSKMTWLTSLNISGNYFTELPDSITNLMKLFTLVIADSNGKIMIRRAPGKISALTCYYMNPDLKNLELYMNHDNESIKDVGPLIGSWKACERISIANNQISKLPHDLSLLTTLRDLNLSGNRFTHLPSVIPQMTWLTSLNLACNLFTELPPSLTEIGNLANLVLIDAAGKVRIQRAPVGISLLPCFNNNSELQALKLYKFDQENLASIDTLVTKWRGCRRIDISKNKISNIPTAISTLHQLIFFNASQNLLTDLPPSLMSVTSLVYLDVSSNKLSDIPKSIQGFQKLYELNIENNQIQKLPFALGCIESLKVLKFNGNPIQDPPRNILNLGLEAVINYLQSSNQGTLMWTQGRILLLGEGKVGKSTLIKALTQKYTFKFDSVCDENRERTDGIARIDLDETSFGRLFQTKLLVKVWDFGGQDEFQVTHPFFLTSGALVIVLYSLSQSASENKLDRWVKMLDEFAPGSTVLIVGTHRDKRNETTLPQIQADIERMKRLNPKKHKFLSTEIQVSSFDGKGISDLKAKIYQALMSLENINLEIPKQYILLKEFFEDKGKTTKTMTLEEVEHFSKVSLKMKETQLHTALSFLHDLGSILWYSGQQNLRGVIFLDPLFIIDVFRSVFSFQGIGKQHNGLILKDALRKKVEQTAKTHLTEETFKVVCGIFEFFGLSVPYSEHTMAFPVLMGTRSLEKVWINLPEQNCFSETEFTLESESVLEMSHRARILASPLKLYEDEGSEFLPTNALSSEFCVVFFDYHPRDNTFSNGTGFKALVHLQEKSVRVAVRSFHPTTYSGEVSRQLLRRVQEIHEHLFIRIKFNCPECKELGSKGILYLPSLESDHETWMLCSHRHVVDVQTLMDGTYFNPKGEGLLETTTAPIGRTLKTKPGCHSEKIEFKEFDEMFATLLLKDRIDYHASCGRGTFGEVFKAHYKGREVAVKKIKVRDQEALTEISNEVLAMHKCQSDYIVKVFHLQRTDKEVSIIMELATKSLDKRAEEGPFTKKEIVHFASNIASGLKFIFSQSIFHHDLKAQNILIIGRTAKLCDFGLAQQRQRQEIASFLATRDGGGLLSGTINWQGPEIYNKTFHLENDDPYLDNAGHRGEASDVYAFGLLVWYLVVREEPFAGNSAADVAVLVRNGSRPIIPHDVHVVLKRIIRTCWSQNYKLRPKIDHVLSILSESHDGNLDSVPLKLLDSVLPIRTRPVKEMSPGEVIEIARDKGVSPEGIEKLVSSGAFLGSLVSKLSEEVLCGKPYQLSQTDARVVLDLCQKIEESKPVDFRRSSNIGSRTSSQNSLLSAYNEFAAIEFKPTSLIGSGGFGDVYRVEFKSEVYAVKVHRIRPINQSEEQMKIQQEAELLSNLRHTNITRLLWHGQHANGAMIYVMEFADQGSLADILRKSPLNDQQFFSYTQDMIRGLLYLHIHSPPITHRDMKPENVLIVGNVAKLADFGTASSREMVSKSTGLAGTPIWSPPEAFHGRFPGPPGDIYAFGLILWTMLTNVAPYSGLGIEATMFAKLSNQLPPIPVDCPPELADCISKCWQIDPSQRPKASALDTIFESIPKAMKLQKTLGSGTSSTQGNSNSTASSAALGPPPEYFNFDLTPPNSKPSVVRPNPPKPIAEMKTDELIAYLRGQKGVVDSFLNGLKQEEVNGEGFFNMLDAEVLSEAPFSLKGLQLKGTLKAIDELRLM